MGCCSSKKNDPPPYQPQPYVPPTSNPAVGHQTITHQSNSNTYNAPKPSSNPSPNPVSKVMYLMDLTIVSGRNLPSHDIIGHSDPFCVLSFGRKVIRTKTIDNQSNPQWNHRTVTFIMEHELKQMLIFGVYDQDEIDENDFIGRVSISPMQYPANVVHNLTLNLLDSNQRNAGDITITLKLYDKEGLMKWFWKQLFEVADLDGNGVLTPNEVELALNIIGYKDMNKIGIQKMFSMMDTDRNGKIDYNEFVTYLVSERLSVVPASSHPLSRNAEKIRQDLQAEKGFDPNEDHIWYLGMEIALAGSSEDDNKVARALMTGSGWLTEEEAAQNNSVWGLYYSNRKQGNLKEGAYIIVQDRYTGVTQQEKIPNFLLAGMSLMYGNDAGAYLSEFSSSLLRKMTESAESKYSSPESAKDIPDFIKFHNLKMADFIQPPGGYKNFNEFFIRKVKPEARPITSPFNPEIAIIPADSRCTVFLNEESSRVWIKGEQFTIAGMIGDSQLASQYGTIVITRLAPQDYHRCHFATGGRIRSITPLGREYYSVNPVAVRSPINVFMANRRVIIVQDSPEFGTVTYCVVGATMVGSIVLAMKVGDVVKKGDELNYFAFGGSTLITLFPKGSIDIELDLLQNSKQPIETVVQFGQPLGAAIRRY